MTKIYNASCCILLLLILFCTIIQVYHFSFPNSARLSGGCRCPCPRGQGRGGPGSAGCRRLTGERTMMCGQLTLSRSTHSSHGRRGTTSSLPSTCTVDHRASTAGQSHSVHPEPQGINSRSVTLSPHWTTGHQQQVSHTQSTLNHRASTVGQSHSVHTEPQVINSRSVTLSPHWTTGHQQQVSHTQSTLNHRSSTAGQSHSVHPEPQGINSRSVTLSPH